MWTVDKISRHLAVTVIMAIMKHDMSGQPLSTKVPIYRSIHDCAGHVILGRESAKSGADAF